MKTLKDLGDVRGKRIFLRCDFNVPVTDGKIDDTHRIEKTLPTIVALRDGGAKLILASHIESEGASTLRPVFEYLKGKLDLSFIDDYYRTDISPQIDALPEGSIVLLENLRKYPEEKENDEAFAKHLASFADAYVDDAFAVAHRKHASLVGIPKHIPGYAGLLLEAEVENLSASFNPPHPFVFVIGGAKFDTKLPLISKFLDLADAVFVGGALANDLFKARGYNVGRSLLSEGADVSAIVDHPKVIIPMDVVVQGPNGRGTKRLEEVGNEDKIFDAGPETIVRLEHELMHAAMTLWNGPLGNFEAGYKEGTEALARAMSEYGGRTIVGGGDTLSAIQSLGVEGKFSFVSTGGGAMLDFLANGTLPGVEALK